MNEYRVTYYYPGEQYAQALVRARNWQSARADVRTAHIGCNVATVEIRVGGRWQPASYTAKRATLECPPPITRRVQLPMGLDS